MNSRTISSLECIQLIIQIPWSSTVMLAFHSLSSQITPDKVYSFALAIAEGKELPGMNLQYFYRNPEWNPASRPKILTLPEIDDDLDL